MEAQKRRRELREELPHGDDAAEETLTDRFLRVQKNKSKAIGPM